MNFLNDYKKGGDKADETGNLGGYIYLSKKHEQDLVLKLRRAFVKVSENPKDAGAEKAIFEFEIGEINETDQEDIEVGDVVSYMINMTPANKLAVEPALKECVAIMSAITGVREHDYFKSLQSTTKSKQSLLEKHFEDDCAVAQGSVVRVTTPDDPNSKGWYNLEWETIETTAKAA